MDINEFLENTLNEKTGHIKKKDLKKIIPELKLTIENKIKDTIVFFGSARIQNNKD